MLLLLWGSVSDCPTLPDYGQYSTSIQNIALPSTTKPPNSKALYEYVQSADDCESKNTFSVRVLSSYK